MSVKSVTIVLKSEGKLVAVLDLERGADPVMVGRSSSCALCTPHEDKAISAKHARFFWKGGNLYLEDAGSRNGVFKNNERLDGPMKVKFGDIFTIGSCTLEAEKPKAPSAASGRRDHQLRFTRSGKRGRRISIKPDSGSGDGVFTIGSIPGSGLYLNDHNVSRHHAKILIEDGDCWIVDDGSRNGTFVNGERVGEKKQLLKAGDKISILQYELEFDPGSDGPDVRWMLIVLSLLGAIGVGIWLWYSIIGPTPPASVYRMAARNAAEEENFGRALAYLEKAKTAKDADQPLEKPQNDKLGKDIEEWKLTFGKWVWAKDCLSKTNLVEARAALDALKDPMLGWNWNTNSAQRAKADAYYCNGVMRRYTDARDFIGRLEEMIRARREEEKGVSPAKSIKAQIDDINRYLSSADESRERLGCLVPVFGEIGKERDKLIGVLKGVELVDGTIGGIDSGNPDFRNAAGVMEGVAKDKTMPFCVVKYAESLLPFCRKFVQTQDFLENERRMVADMEFIAVVRGAKNIPLPPLDACGKNEKLSDSRAAFLRRHEAYLNEVKNLSPMVDNLEKLGVRDGKKGAILEHVCKRESWDPVLAFDCFQKRLPRPSRIDPTGEYDRLVGIEYTYDVLRKLPKMVGVQFSVPVKFTPECRKARDAFEQIVTFLKYMDRRESKEFMGGKLGRLYLLGTQILADRDQLIEMLKDQERKATKDREKIVAGYYAQYFSDNPAEAALKGLESLFKQLEKTIGDLPTPPDPEERIEQRKKILGMAIPGMPGVRDRWLEEKSE